MLCKLKIFKLLMPLLGLALWTGTALADGSHYQLGVDGLACPFCAFGIEKKLSSIPGVTDTRVDLKQGMVIVTMKDGSQLSEPVARAKVKDAGFSLRSFARADQQ